MLVPKLPPLTSQKIIKILEKSGFVLDRVKGRNIGKPEFGKYEILKEGNWIIYSDRCL